MKKIKLYKHKIALKVFSMAALLVVSVSCSDDILNKQPLDAISEDNVFNDATFLQNYVYNAYNGIRPPWSPGTGGYIGLTDIAISQETHGKASGFREYLAGNLTPDNITDVTDMWNEEFNYIRRINIFFENIENSAIEPSVLNPMKGEMHFIRAWIYFDLARIYGGVPIITNTFKLDDENFDIARNSYDEVAQFVLDECNLAINYLDGIDPVPGKVSQQAAMALKARMLLYMASPLNNPSNDEAKWKAAEVGTKAVIDAGFSLHPTHEDLFLQPLKTDEIIFGKSFTTGNRIPDWGYNYDYWPSGFDAQQKLSPTQAFVNMFQLTNGEYPYLEDDVTVNPASGYDPQDPNIDRDPRYYSYVIYPGAGPFDISDGSKSTVRVYEYWEDANPNPDNVAPYQNPNKVDKYNGQTLYDFGRDSKTYWIKGLTPFHWRVQTGYTFKKMLDFSGPRASYDFDYNQVVVYMRLAEFYYNYAEIQIALGNENEAREYINKVRSRPSVNMPDITSTGAELVREYKNERAVELHLEDSRFFDLMRWKDAPGKVDRKPLGLTSVTMDWTGAAEGDLIGKLHYTYGEVIGPDPRAPWPGDYYYVFPIPRVEIQRSNNKLEQNPVYK